MSDKKPSSFDEEQLSESKKQTSESKIQTLESKKQTLLQALGTVISIIVGILSLFGLLYLPSPINLFPITGIFFAGIVIGYVAAESRKGPKFVEQIFALMRIKTETRLSGGLTASNVLYQNLRNALIAIAIDAGKTDLADELKSERWD